MIDEALKEGKVFRGTRCIIHTYERCRSNYQRDTSHFSRGGLQWMNLGYDNTCYVRRIEEEKMPPYLRTSWGGGLLCFVSNAAFEGNDWLHSCRKPLIGSWAHNLGTRDKLTIMWKKCYAHSALIENQEQYYFLFANKYYLRTCARGDGPGWMGWVSAPSEKQISSTPCWALIYSPFPKTLLHDCI